jgi:hypothetical protein
MLFGVSCATNSPPPDKEICGKVTLTDQWLEITFPEPIKPEREITEIVIWFAEGTNYCDDSKGEGIRLADGSAVMPEVYLTNQDEKIYEFKKISGLDKSGIALRWSLTNLPKDKAYTKIHLKSSKPLECRQIVWRNYNPWDYK